MSPTSIVEKAFETAVNPVADRLLAGVALAAAGRSQTDGIPYPPDYTAAFGTVQLDPSSDAVTAKTVMWLASCTKLVTTIAVLQCIQRGLFALDDPTDVESWLPEWNDVQILTGFTADGAPMLQPAQNKITLLQLLTHTSGLSYDFFHPLLVQWRQSRGEGSLVMRKPITECFSHPLSFEPGSSWWYSAGLDLAGLMVARANKTTLEAYMRENIFDVLGMNETSFHPKKHNEMITRLMPMSSRLASGQLVDGMTEGAPVEVPVDPVDDFGGSGLFSTADDYLKLLKSVLRDDGKLLKTDSIDAMFTPALTDSQRDGLNAVLSNAFAASILAPGEAVVGTPGAGQWTHSIGGLMGLHDSDDGFAPGWLQWGGAPNLKWWIDRKGGTCGVVATQLNPAGDVKHVHLTKLFQREMVKHFAGGQS